MVTDRMTRNCGISVTKLSLSLWAGFYNHGAITGGRAFRRKVCSQLAGFQKGGVVTDWLAFRRAGLSLIGWLLEGWSCH